MTTAKFCDIYGALSASPCLIYRLPQVTDTPSLYITVFTPCKGRNVLSRILIWSGHWKVSGFYSVIGSFRYLCQRGAFLHWRQNDLCVGEKTWKNNCFNKASPSWLPSIYSRILHNNCDRFRSPNTLLCRRWGNFLSVDKVVRRPSSSFIDLYVRPGGAAVMKSFAATV